MRCGSLRVGPGGGGERVAGVEVWEVEHELIGPVGHGLVTVEERREGVPVTHLELGGARCRVPRCTEGVRSVAYGSTHVASVALMCLMMPPMLRALTVGVAAACASVRPCAVWRRKLRWTFNVSRRSARSAVVVASALLACGASGRCGRGGLARPAARQRAVVVMQNSIRPSRSIALLTAGWRP